MTSSGEKAVRRADTTLAAGFRPHDALRDPPPWERATRLPQNVPRWTSDLPLASGLAQRLARWDVVLERSPGFSSWLAARTRERVKLRAAQSHAARPPVHDTSRYAIAAEPDHLATAMWASARERRSKLPRPTGRHVVRDGQRIAHASFTDPFRRREEPRGTYAGWPWRGMPTAVASPYHHGYEGSVDRATGLEHPPEHVALLGRVVSVTDDIIVAVISSEQDSDDFVVELPVYAVRPGDLPGLAPGATFEWLLVRAIEATGELVTRSTIRLLPAREFSEDESAQARAQSAEILRQLSAFRSAPKAE